MEKMLALAEKEGIAVEYADFRLPLLGVYFAKEKLPPVIALNENIIDNRVLLRSVMAEELGHYFTLVGVCMPAPCYDATDRLQHIATGRMEYKALKWAANYLIPGDKLKQAAELGITGQQEIADYFEVMPYIAELKLRLWEAELDNDRHHKTKKHPPKK